jgi:hypothetical protein
MKHEKGVRLFINHKIEQKTLLKDKSDVVVLCSMHSR